METREVLKGKYFFVNETKDTRSGFKHTSILLRKGGSEIARHNCNYLNRTWETYRYQTSMRSVISNLIENLQELALREYKRDNNIGRLTKQKKDKILKELEKEKQMREYRKIYKELNYSV